MPSEQQQQQTSAAPTKKKIRPVIIIREARESDRDDIIHFEQSLAQETEGKTLDAASIKRGVELPLKPRPSLGCLPPLQERLISRSFSNDDSRRIQRSRRRF